MAVLANLIQRQKYFKIIEHDDFDNNSLSSSSINCIYKDPRGNIWIGTYNAGVNFIDPDRSKFTHYKHSLTGNTLSNNNVLSIYEDTKDESLDWD